MCRLWMCWLGKHLKDPCSILNNSWFNTSFRTILHVGECSIVIPVLVVAPRYFSAISVAETRCFLKQTITKFYRLQLALCPTSIDQRPGSILLVFLETLVVHLFDLAQRKHKIPCGCGLARNPGQNVSYPYRDVFGACACDVFCVFGASSAYGNEFVFHTRCPGADLRFYGGGAKSATSGAICLHVVSVFAYQKIVIGHCYF